MNKPATGAFRSAPDLAWQEVSLDVLREEMTLRPAAG